MKVTRFRKRERRIADRADGSVICTISVPLLEERFQIRTLASPVNAIENARKFVIRHLDKRTAQLDGASFVVAAMLRARSGALRPKVLCEWTFGEDIDEAFKAASAQWQRLEFEEDWSSYKTEIENE